MPSGSVAAGADGVALGGDAEQHQPADSGLRPPRPRPSAASPGCAARPRASTRAATGASQPSLTNMRQHQIGRMQPGFGDQPADGRRCGAAAGAARSGTVHRSSSCSTASVSGVDAVDRRGRQSGSRVGRSLRRPARQPGRRAAAAVGSPMAPPGQCSAAIGVPANALHRAAARSTPPRRHAPAARSAATAAGSGHRHRAVARRPGRPGNPCAQARPAACRRPIADCGSSTDSPPVGRGPGRRQRGGRSAPGGTRSTGMPAGAHALRRSPDRRRRPGCPRDTGASRRCLRPLDAPRRPRSPR